MTNHNENLLNSNEIRVLINVGQHFIEEKQIRSATRFGKGTKILLNNGDEIAVNVPYEKVADVLSTSQKR